MFPPSVLSAIALRLITGIAMRWPLEFTAAALPHHPVLPTLGSVRFSVRVAHIPPGVVEIRSREGEFEPKV